MHQIAIIVGSLRKESINKQLARATVEEGKDLFSFTWVDIADVPLFNQDLEDDPPAPVTRMRGQITPADAVLFVTPEYNRSIPGVLKNITDWGSRPSGKGCLVNKPAAIIGATFSSVGTAVSQSHLRSVLTILGMPLIAQPEMYITLKPESIGADGAFADPGTKRFFRGFLESVHTWMNTYIPK